MSRRSNIRKRERKKRFYALHPKPVDKPIPRIKTADLITDLSRPLHSAAFAEVLKEQI